MTHCLRQHHFDHPSSENRIWSSSSLHFGLLRLGLPAHVWKTNSEYGTQIKCQNKLTSVQTFMVSTWNCKSPSWSQYMHDGWYRCMITYEARPIWSLKVSRKLGSKWGLDHGTREGGSTCRFSVIFMFFCSWW